MGRAGGAGGACRRLRIRRQSGRVFRPVRRAAGHDRRQSPGTDRGFALGDHRGVPGVCPGAWMWLATWRPPVRSSTSPRSGGGQKRRSAARRRGRRGATSAAWKALRERDLLFARLLQYRAFKQAADDFRARLAANSGRFPHPAVMDAGMSALLPELVWTLTPEDLARLAAQAFANAPAARCRCISCICRWWTCAPNPCWCGTGCAPCRPEGR